MTLSLQLPSVVDVGVLDKILTSAFHINIEPLRLSSVVPADKDLRTAAGVLWRGMLLARDLLQAAGIPVFDSGYIANVQRQEQLRSWALQFFVPQVDHVDATCYKIAYNGATSVVMQLLQPGVSPEQLAALVDKTDEQVIDALRQRSASGKSTIPVLRAAHAMGLPFLHLGAGAYQLGWGSRARKIDRSSADSDAAIGSRLTHNKISTAHLLRMAGLPAPVHGVVGTAEKGLAVAEQLGWPVVVKPADSDRGEGVSVGVLSAAQLSAAFERARNSSKSKQVIVERQVQGVCHRLFVAFGRLLYAVKRLPKSVAGDGVHTVSELIALANETERALPPWLKSEPFPVDAQAVEAVNAAGFAMDSVPRAGELVPLRMIESTADGGVDEDVTDRIHPDNLDIALRAAKLFHLDVAGIDIITTDISRSWEETAAIINEVNYSPLLGGAAISRSHVPEFLKRVMGDGDGRIPVDVYVGGDDVLATAMQARNHIAAAGRRCFLTSHNLTVDGEGKTMPIPLQGLLQRCRALLLDARVDHLVLVVQTDEPLRRGLPIDRIGRLVMGENISEESETLPLAGNFQHLAAYLKNLVW